jgi:queuine tRNA-ribosyltransferase
MLLTWHNLHYFQEIMQQMRDAIAADDFAGFESQFHAQRALGDLEPLS